MATAVWKAELLEISPAQLNSLRKEIRCRQVMDVSPPNSLPSGEYVLLGGKRSRAVNLDSRFDGAISTPERVIRMKRISENLVSEEREFTRFSEILFILITLSGVEIAPSNRESRFTARLRLSVNLDSRFDGAISTPERVIRMKRISENLVSEERELTTVSEKGPASTNSTVSQLEPRLKKRRVEAADSTMERRFEALERMEADNVDLRGDNVYLRDRLKRVEARLEEVERRMKLYVSSGISLIAAACSLVEG